MHISVTGEARPVAGGRSVLVVEDDPATRLLVSELLGPELGVAVRGAANGRAAIAAVGANPPDLILLDLILPDLDGLEVLRRLKASPGTAKIPVLAFTASTPETTLRALDGGCRGFVRKPFDIDELLAVVRGYVQDPDVSDSVASAAG